MLQGDFYREAIAILKQMNATMEKMLAQSKDSYKKAVQIIQDEPEFEIGVTYSIKDLQEPLTTGVCSLDKMRVYARDNNLVIVTDVLEDRVILVNQVDGPEPTIGSTGLFEGGSTK